MSRLELNERVEEFNRDTRELLQQYVEHHGGCCWLGRLNLHDVEGCDKVLWEYDGGEVPNLGADFAIPAYDAEIERLIISRNQIKPWSETADQQALEDVFKRIAKLKGIYLPWA